MQLSMKQSLAVANMAKALYDFLPGSGHPSWKGHVNFGTVAKEAGVGDFWGGGSKLPAITKLLELTLENRAGCFERLVLTIVKRGIADRLKGKKPITRLEMMALNQMIREVGFKFPELWDEEFLNSLPEEKSTVVSPEPGRAVSKSPTTKDLEVLKNQFDAITVMPNRQAAGYEFEKLLNRMFTVFGLGPRSAFRVVGEQIDGSILLDNEVYLIEAKWVTHQVAANELFHFRGKIEGKSSFTRGIFISIHGFTPDGMTALSQGKQPVFFLKDGFDIRSVLEGTLRLDDMLREKSRRLAETGQLLYRPQLNLNQ